MNRYKYSVVIVTYNRLALLKECLEHCFLQTIPFTQIVVVDNNSNDGTKEYLDDLAGTDRRLLIFHAEKNTGGAGGFHKALELADKGLADYILLIDDDAIIDCDYIEKIEPFITEEIGAYSGCVLMQNGGIPRQRHMLCSKTFLLLKGADPALYEQPFFDYDISSFCGLLLSTKLIKKAGLPLAEYYIWHDDVEYSLRLRGATIFRNVNGARLIHKTGAAFSTHRFCWKSYYGGRNSWDVAKKYSAHPHIYDACRFLYHTMSILLYSILSVLPKERGYHCAVVKMHRDILQFRHDGTLGIHPDYTPESVSALSDAPSGSDASS
ncbi:MAG: glycosyltransferase [Lachnospiraceae bacterium]|nr:glycosyltransferase [Lachnospiraceae bacterium]